jgi:protein-L-isoaspartate(D-aspartate) O-methyltransferase
MLDFFQLNANLSFGDGYKGNRVYAPYDRILVTCGAPEIPTVLLEQLKVDGFMIIPVGEGAEQKMLRIHKTSETSYSSEEFGTFKFVPMLERTVK